MTFRIVLFILLFVFNPGFLSKALGQQAPDYSDLSYWAAHPDKDDPSDRTPGASVSHLSENKKIDIFFLHPTTHTKGNPKQNWNGDILNEKLRTKTEEGTILHQASIFNGAGNVYAPFYRQAHIKSYYTKDKATAKKAFDLAYEDVRAAFIHYLKFNNNGRPFIIAAHSQGTNHATTLIQEIVDLDSQLRNQLVAAYLVGMPIPKNAFKKIPVCETPEQTNCFCSWRTFKEEYTPKKYVLGDTIAVTNPISWTTNKEKVDKSKNKGSVLKDFDAGFTQQLVGAQIHNGMLWVDKPKFPGSFLLTTKNYHIADFNLFYESVRENSIARVERFYQKHNKQ